MRKIFRMAIVCVIAGAALLAGCTKDYASAISNLNEEIVNVKDQVRDLTASVGELRELINKGYVITDVKENADGFLITFSNSDTKQVYNGKPGDPGHSPEVAINADGYWTIDGKATTVKAKGEDGHTPEIGINADGFWTVDGKATTVKAKGEDGHSPVVTIAKGEDGELYWAIDGTLTTYKAQGPKGDAGNYWTIDTTTYEFVEWDGATKKELSRVSIYPDGARPVTAIWDTTKNTLTFANVKKGNEYVEYTIDLTPVMSSIVAVPDLYYGGIEAFEYNYLNYNTSINVKSELETGFKDDDDSEALIKQLNKPQAPNPAVVDQASSIAEVKYWINPASYNAELTANASFDIEGTDYNYMDVALKSQVGGIEWNPQIYTANYANGVKKVKDNLYKVQFTISKPGKLQPQTMNTAGNNDVKSDVSVVRLSGYDKNNQLVLDEAKEVSSDYAALVPMEQGLAALAFNLKPDEQDYDDDGDVEKYYDSDQPCGQLIDAATGAAKTGYYHLYSTARLAIEGNGIPVTWNGGSRKINFVTLHVHPADYTKPRTCDDTKAVEMSIADFIAKYPGFSIKYDLVPYTLGKDGLAPDNDNITPEDWFGKIEGSGTDWKFIPCYGDRAANDSSKPIAEVDPAKGISAVGRRPLVLARLYDPQGRVALAGYFKFQIVQKPIEVVVPDPTCDGTTVRDFSDQMIAFTCDRDSLHTDWLDMSSTILENYLKIDYRAFRKDYEIYYKNGATTGTAEAGYTGYVLDTYVLKSGKTGKNLGDYELSKTSGEFTYGTITYVPDPSGNATGGGVNDVFFIYLTKAQKQAIKNAGGTKTLYFKVKKKGTNDYYMLGFTIKIAPTSAVEFVLHNGTYWWTDVDKTKPTTVRRNVQVPEHWMPTTPADNSDVTLYTKLLTDDWDGHVVKIKGSSTIPEVEWSFDSDQPFKYNGKSFKVHNTDSATNPATTDDQFLSFESQTDTVVVLNRKTGRLTYYYSKNDPDHIAKRLLNLYAPKETDPNKMLYCKVKLTAKSYLKDAAGNIVMNARTGKPECEIELGSESFYARFLRPLTLSISKDAKLRDGVAIADFFPIGTFIEEARDWNAAESPDGLGYKIFQKKADGTFETCYKDNPTTGNHEVDWYGYYGFKNIVIDLANIETDQLVVRGDGPRGKLTAINSQAKVWIAKAATPQTPVKRPVDGSASLPINNISDLADWVFAYENHQGSALDFHLYVPVSIEYSWGKIGTGEFIEVPVKGTQFSQGN